MNNAHPRAPKWVRKMPVPEAHGTGEPQFFSTAPQEGVVLARTRTNQYWCVWVLTPTEVWCLERPKGGARSVCDLYLWAPL
jgi:hypothetical protein